MPAVGGKPLTGRKNGKHGAVSMAPNIAGLSYIAVRLFEQMHKERFRIVPTFTSPFQTRAFARILPSAFLILLTSPASSCGPEKMALSSPNGLEKLSSLKDKRASAALDKSMRTFRKKTGDDS